MAFKMVLDSLEGLPEDVAKEYVERDGKFHIQVEGMKTQADIDRVQTSLTAARTEATTLKGRLALLGDRKVEDVVTLLDRIPELEAAAEGKLDDEKLNSIVETRIKTRTAPLERELGTLKTQLAEKDTLLEALQGKEKTRTLHEQIRNAGKEAKLLDTAIEDALLLGERVFELDDSGNAVVKKDSGFTEGLAPKDWFTDLQAKRPHWWGDSIGGGAGGNRGNGGGPEGNPWTAENWNMTEQGKILNANRSRAETLAKAAGTTIGGQKPPAKK